MTNKTIWIWGDSWAEPLWDNPLPNSNPENHLEFILKRKGYSVINYGKVGEDNLYSINLSKKSSTNPDYILWYHTECFRSKVKDNERWYIEDKLKELSIKIYTEAANIVRKTNSKLIVIEGQSVVYKSTYESILKKNVHYKIDDWRSFLVGYKLPECHFISCYHHLEHNCLDSAYKKIKILKDVEVIRRATENHYHFPDQGHPGDKAQTLLADKLDKIINKY